MLLIQEVYFAKLIFFAVNQFRSQVKLELVRSVCFPVIM